LRNIDLETLRGAVGCPYSTQGENAMIDDPKEPVRPVEEPSERPSEVPGDGGDTDFPGSTPDEVPEHM
jgi:hypothetical protein